MPTAQPAVIRLVAGLGNPGEEYAETRHNAGFKAVDELAQQGGVSYWKNQSGALVATITVNTTSSANTDQPIISSQTSQAHTHEVLLVKPQSYMNTSGGPISKLCAAYGISPEEVLVIHDELDIPAGDVRVKVGGGHAGHNGLRSIIDKLGSRDFSRIRVGIGAPPGRMPVADYVLKQLKNRDLDDFNNTTYRAAEAAVLALSRGIVFARDHVNGSAGRNGKHA